MRVLMFISNLGAGGAQRQLVNLAILLKREGFDVSFLTYHPDNFFLSLLNENKINLVCIEEKRWWKRLWKIRSFIRAGTQDVVLSYLKTPNFIACISGIGKRDWGLIISERGASKVNFTSFTEKLKKVFAYYADFLVTNSKNAAAMWCHFFPFVKGKIHTIYNVVREFPSSNVNYVYHKNGKFNLVVAACFTTYKNINGVIEAVALLDVGVKERLRLDWYGATGGCEEVLNNAREQLQRHNLGNTIFLYDPIDTLYEKMVQADAVGLFSFFEGMPNVICEAMSLGKPIIMSRVSDAEVLVDEKNGFLCDAGDCASIGAAIKAMSECSEEELHSRGLESRKNAEVLFGERPFVDAYVSLFNKAIAQVRNR
jgi:glycosyltransferase involved in cell wall biosynthesis